MTKRILIGLTGAAGSIYGVRILQELQKVDDIESHLIVSRAGLLNVATELDMRRSELEALADVVHSKQPPTGPVSHHHLSKMRAPLSGEIPRRVQHP